MSEEIRTQVAPIARSLSATPPSASAHWLGPRHSISGVAAHLAVAVGAYDEKETSGHLLKLLAGTSLRYSALMGG
jgi:hypothetical protein